MGKSRSKHYSYYPLSPSEICFLHETRGTSSFQVTSRVLLLTSRDNGSPFSQAAVRPVCLRKGSDSSAESKNMVSITPDLNAVHQAQRCCRLLLQKLSLTRLNKAKETNPFIQNTPQISFHLQSYLYKFHHISSQVPSSWGEAGRRRDVPPQHRVVFSPDQARLL